jgi:hypothetical protein
MREYWKKRLRDAVQGWNDGGYRGSGSGRYGLGGAW